MVSFNFAESKVIWACILLRAESFLLIYSIIYWLKRSELSFTLTSAGNCLFMSATSRLSSSNSTYLLAKPSMPPKKLSIASISALILLTAEFSSYCCWGWLWGGSLWASFNFRWKRCLRFSSPKVAKGLEPHVLMAGCTMVSSEESPNYSRCFRALKRS
jgi:hypothetical protein